MPARGGAGAGVARGDITRALSSVGGWSITTMMRRGVGGVYDRGAIIHRWWFIITRRGIIFINV